MALPIFAVTIFVSAFLLFLVQPLVGKLILPKLGGTPQVWNTCMVFFQSVLLLGYAYTHTVSTKLKLRQQLMVHGAVLMIPILMLLFFPIYGTVVGDETHPGWSPPPGSNPIIDTLGLLAMIIGVPFFVVSTSAPLLQKWFGYSGHHTAQDPYYLYSVSNLGSLLSLFFYPAMIEPFTYLQTQSNIWFGGYVVLAGLILYCAYTIYKTAPPDDVILAAESASAAPAPAAPEAQAPAPTPAPAPAVEASTAMKSGPAPGGRGRKKHKQHARTDVAVPSIAEREAPEPVIAKGANADMTWWRRIRWVLLAAVPSSMMLGVTSYVSTDLSPFPLVWVIPLALYLLSFIFVYERMMKWTGKRYQIGGGSYTLHQMTVYVAQPLGLIVLCFIALTHRFDPIYATAMVMLGFFANALACHGELAEDRPDPKHLTEYFLMMSVGGMVGGLFNGIIAPVVFQTGVLEFYVVIVVACMVRPQYVKSGWFDELIMSAFPQLQSWARGQGDEMAKSLGRTPPHSTYLFSIFLDVIFGLFLLSISYWLTTGSIAESVLKNMKVSRNWAPFFYNAMIYGIPMVFCFFFAGRPLRMGLGIAGLMLGTLYLGSRGEDRYLVEARRTYFGVLRVEKKWEYPEEEEEKTFMRRDLVKMEGEMKLPPFEFTYLMHGTTYHGRNYKYEAGDSYDLSRLATTYYHRYGPVGLVMERDNWVSNVAGLDWVAKGTGAVNPKSIPEPGATRQNSYWADMRMPAAIMGDVMGALGTGVLPLQAVLEVWSEPPFATIGLGTGTMIGYARPYQHMTYYEIDDVIKEFNMPDDGGVAHFTFLQSAVRRGVSLEIIMGDARLSLEPKREPNNIKNSFLYHGEFGKQKFAGEAKIPPRPYANATYAHQDGTSPNREKYYKVINVDAFSSDAIPVHLVTMQAIKIYMSKLRDDGVLCVHTSNRHMDLVRPVTRIAMELDDEAQKNGTPRINVRVGKDAGSRGSGLTYMGHFGSEYVMIYRGDGFSDYLKKLEDKKKEFVNNLNAVRDKKDPQAALAGKLWMRPDGKAPDGWTILNSPVEWYNSYTDHPEVRNGRLVKVDIRKERLWTDDYSYILGVLRLHWPWE